MPSGVTAALAQARLIATWREAESAGSGVENATAEGSDDEGLGPALFPVLLDSVGKFGGQRIGQPLGASLPCLIIANADDAAQTNLPRTWQDYESAVEQMTQRYEERLCRATGRWRCGRDVFISREQLSAAGLVV